MIRLERRPKQKSKCWQSAESLSFRRRRRRALDAKPANFLLSLVDVAVTAMLLDCIIIKEVSGVNAIFLLVLCSTQMAAFARFHAANDMRRRDAFDKPIIGLTTHKCNKKSRRRREAKLGQLGDPSTCGLPKTYERAAAAAVAR